MHPMRPTSRRRLWFQFLAGLFYLAIVSVILCVATGRPFAVIMAAVVVTSLLCSGLVLLWLTLWAVRKDSRLGQFGIGSLFFLTVFVALYFSAVRWVVQEIERNPTELKHLEGTFPPVAITGLFVVYAGIPFVARMTESLMWFAVWLVRRPSIKRFLARRRRTD